MASWNIVTEQDIKKIKLLAERGLSCSEIESVTGRSSSTVIRCINGYYDKPQTKPEKAPPAKSEAPDGQEILKCLNLLATQNEEIIGLLETIRREWL